MFLVRLFRPRLALLNGVAALGGYFLFSTQADARRAGAVFLGVVLLAAAGSALNQVMEQDLDRLMVRTRLRPLPQGQLTWMSATGIGAGAALAGSLMLWTGGNAWPVLLGLGALLWYLIVYTPLKRRTAFAPVIGAPCGAIPPMIGWSSAGGNPLDFQVMLLAGLLFLWQIPHFWLFQRRHMADYRNANLPCLADSSPGRSFPGLVQPWLMALIAASMLLPAFGLIGPRFGIWYSLFPLALLVISLRSSESTLFSCLNLFPLLITAVLFINGIFY